MIMTSKTQKRRTSIKTAIATKKTSSILLMMSEVNTIYSDLLADLNSAFSDTPSYNREVGAYYIKSRIKTLYKV